MRPDIVPGGVFPDYELPDHTSTLRKLSELQGDDPLILTLARGHYCPKEHQQHLELAAFYPKIAVAYTQIATISTDDNDSAAKFPEVFSFVLRFRFCENVVRVKPPDVLTFFTEPR
jgi:peroxiredoxin